MPSERIVMSSYLCIILTAPPEHLIVLLICNSLPVSIRVLLSRRSLLDRVSRLIKSRIFFGIPRTWLIKPIVISFQLHRRLISERFLFSKWLFIHILLSQVMIRELIRVKVLLGFTYTGWFGLRRELIARVIVLPLVLVSVEQVINLVAQVLI